MASMIAGWIASIILNNLVKPFLGMMADAMMSTGKLSLALAHQPWVAQAEDVSLAVAGGLLFLNLAYRALAEYVLWNEGSSSDVSGTLIKGVFRAAIYSAAGATIAYLTFKFGFELAAAYMSAPVKASVNTLATLVNAVSIGTGGGVLPLALMILAALIALLWVFLTMYGRAAELAIFVIAAPIVGLGQMNRDGGIWSNWWRSLVVLALSTAVQWLALKGMIATAVTTMFGTPGGTYIATLEILAWVWVAIRGPHLLKEWSYRTGFASGAGMILGTVVQRGGLRGFIGGGTKI